MNLAKFSVKISLLVNLLSIFLVIAGLFALSQINREAFPLFSFDIVLVQTVYLGASPPEVEKLVTIPLEKELKGVDGIEEMYSESLENYSTIVINIDPDQKKPEKVVRDIERAVDRVKDLPADAEDPEVVEISTKEIPVIEVSLSGKLSEAELQDQAEFLEDRLEDIEGLAKVQRRGWRDREIWVEVDPGKLEEYYVSPREVMKALELKNVNLPGGKLRTPDEEVNVRVLGEFKTPEEVENVIIRANDSGNWLRIRDVARVRSSFEDEDTVYHTEGTRAIRLVLVKKEQGDAIRIVDDAKVIIEEFKEVAPEELNIELINDLSFYIRRRLRVLAGNGLIGIILVLISLFIFLSRPVALFTALGLPIAFLTTFAVMGYLGMSINLITLFGLILVLGMIVDDGIIISENVYRHIENGLPPRQAAIVGAGFLLTFALARDLNVMTLGEEPAAHLGLKVERTKKLFFAVASLMTGATVAACGLIGFVGLIVPHSVRLVVGPDHRRAPFDPVFSGLHGKAQWYALVDAGRFNAGQCTHAPEEFLVEGSAGSFIVVVQRKCQRHPKCFLMVEARVDGPCIEETTNEESRAEQENERYRNLPDHQCTAQTGASQAEGARARIVLQGGGDVRTRRLQRRHGTEDDSCQQ